MEATKTQRPLLPEGFKWADEVHWEHRGKKPSKSKRVERRSRERSSIEALATEFVNLSAGLDPNLPQVTSWVRDFVRSHTSLRLTPKKAAIRAFQLRKAWIPASREFAERLLEEIFAAPRASVTSSPDRYAPIERAAFKIRLGHSRPVFAPRDLLDRIAFAILRASERGLLRTCRGHKRKWNCPTPYLVADENRRVYCYEQCGDIAKSQAKLAWWRKNHPPKRRRAA
jgi:hypothetical protein